MVDLGTIAARLVQVGHGILAADESITTMSSRLAAEGIEPSPEARRDYRELLVTTEGLAETVSGVIVCDETFGQSLASGQAFPEACAEHGLLVGVKVDTGTAVLPNGGGATVTEGLDGLSQRLETYRANGAAFAKWRAVIEICTMNDLAIDANALALARYAALCHAHGVVPIVEPEVLCAGSHDMTACEQVTGAVLDRVFAALAQYDVNPAHIILKPNMVTPGLSGPPADTVAIARSTLRVLEGRVPGSVPGIAFLSGGHSSEAACAYLRAINVLATGAPWNLTYSFGRALVSDALHAWKGDPSRVSEAQHVLLANCARAAAASRAEAMVLS